MLFLLLAGALFGVALRFQLGYNGLHLDEANYLFIGKQLLAGFEWPTKHYVFSSDLPFYWLAAWDALLPGLEGRAGALVAGLVGIFTWLGLIRTFFEGRQAQLIASFLFLSQPTITSISRLATYDVLSFALFGAGLWVSLIAVRSQSARWSVGAGFLLAMAVFAKYVTILFLPIVFIGWFIRWRQWPWFALLTSGSMLAVYGLTFQDDLIRLYSEQIVDAHAANSTFIELVNIVILPLWPLVFAILAMVLAKPAFARSSELKLLVTGALVLVAYHLVALDRVALYKHLAYSSAFLSILAVWLWNRYPEAGSASRFFLFLMLSCHLGNAFLWNQQFQTAWPDTREVVSTLSADSSLELLSENAYLFRSALHGEVPTEKFHDTTFVDLNGDGSHSEEELFEAVSGGRFSHIYLDGMTTPDLSQRLIFGPINRHYELVHFESPPQLSGLDHSGSGLYSAMFRRQDLR